MIIQCEQCCTRFKLDDSRVTDAGVRVRCAKCRNVFSVTREQQEPGPARDFGAVLDDVATAAPVITAAAAAVPEPGMPAAEPESLPLEQETVTAAAWPEEEPRCDAAAKESGIVDDTGEHAAPEEADAVPPGLLTADEPADGIDFGDFQLEGTVSGEEDAAPAAIAGEHADDIEFGDFQLESPEPVADEAMPAAPSGAADDGIDFGDFQLETTATGGDEAAAGELDFSDIAQVDTGAEPGKEETGGLDFSGDDMFGETLPADAGETPETADPGFGMDDFAEAMDVDGKDDGLDSGFAQPRTAADAPFSLDEIDFGDELTAVGVQHVNPEELKPAQDLLFTATAGPGEEPDSPPQTTFAPAAEPLLSEAPPLPATSRRKGSPLVPILLAVAGLLIAAAAAFYSMFSSGSSAPAQDAGRISVRAINARYIKNATAGDLLVISGEAVNEYKKPRAAIQVKGMVFGANGTVLSEKSVFCGNPLTDEQLQKLTMEKLDSAMGNQFGDSLANMEVPPGKTIPFVIVLPRPPADARDYGVEPAGSTVATAKQ